MNKKISKILSVGIALVLSISSVGLINASEPVKLPKHLQLHALQHLGYLGSRKDIQNFTLVNSKAGDAAKMSLVCPIANPTFRDIAMFPNTQTIILDLGDPDFAAKFPQLVTICQNIDNIWLFTSREGGEQAGYHYGLVFPFMKKVTKLILRDGYTPSMMNDIVNIHKLERLSDLIIYDIPPFHYAFNYFANANVKEFLEILEKTKTTIVLSEHSALHCLLCLLEEFPEDTKGKLLSDRENLKILMYKQYVKEIPCKAKEPCPYCFLKFGFDHENTQ